MTQRPGGLAERIGIPVAFLTGQAQKSGLRSRTTHHVATTRIGGNPTVMGETMKRLFVRPDYRGQGLGYRLAMQAVNEASALGYAVMRLDTLEGLESAMRMYAAMGFQRRTPYYANPLPGVVYWERALQNPRHDPTAAG